MYMRGKDCEVKRGEGFKNGIGNKCIRHMRAAIWPIRRAGSWGCSAGCWREDTH